MTQRAIAFMCAILLLACNAGLSTKAVADPFPALNTEQRAEWAAVGRVNGAGFRMRTGCTGTLIAPDIVLTAAHCVGDTDGIGPSRHFVAGWERGRFKAHRPAARVTVDPLYEHVSGLGRYANDLALLYLEDPIPVGLVRPVPLGPRSVSAEAPTMLLGYHNIRPHLLSGRDDCIRQIPPGRDLLLFNCEVINGNSGGPVLVQTDGVWYVQAVLVARLGAQGNALAVELDPWIIQEWQRAMQRHKDRH